MITVYIKKKKKRCVNATKLNLHSSRLQDMLFCVQIHFLNVLLFKVFYFFHKSSIISPSDLNYIFNFVFSPELKPNHQKTQFLSKNV